MAGLKMPTINVVTLSVPLRIDLILTGKFVSAVPKSLADRYSLKVLPVELPARPWSVVIVRLKNRTLSPVVDRFIDCCRQAAESLGGTPSRRKAPGKLSVA